MVEWIANTIHRAKSSRGMEQLSEMSSFLLNTTENYLHRTTSSDDLVRVIMRYVMTSFPYRDVIFVYSTFSFLFHVWNDASRKDRNKTKNKQRFYSTVVTRYFLSSLTFISHLFLFSE